MRIRTAAPRNDGRVHLHCLIPPRLHRCLRQVAVGENTSIGELIAEILGPEVDRRLRQIGEEIANPK